MSKKSCKNCHSLFDSVRNQTHCPDCIDKKEILAIQERMLREIKGYSCINICEDCGNPFGSYSGATKRCTSCRVKKERLKVEEREKKIRENLPLREVLCKCGKIFETRSTSRTRCIKCIIPKKEPQVSAENAITVTKTFNISMDFEEENKFKEYIDKQNRIADKWNRKYHRFKRLGINPPPNLFDFIYNQ